jgi:DNA-binding NtrC family response regulator
MLNLMIIKCHNGIVILLTNAIMTQSIVPKNFREKEMNLELITLHRSGIKEWGLLNDYLRKRKGITVHSVNTVDETVKMIKTRPVHMAIIDYDVPRDSMKLLKRLQSIRPHLEIIFLSENVTLSKAISAMKGGAYDFYEFPVNKRLLLAVIEKASEKQLLYFEKKELEWQVKGQFDFANIVGRSRPIKEVLDVVRLISMKDVTVLITGETGTGKELIASAIHYNSPRAKGPFIKVNCSALSKGVLESELFGHEKGAFTGAIYSRAGRFELADGGCIFLDEVGDIPLSTQVKLLRVLQEKAFERVGGNKTLKVDVRVIAATHRNLTGLIREGKFRENLFYRLNVVNIRVPTLRERKEDIPVLVSYLINRLNEEKRYEIKGVSKGAMEIMLNYKWPGNVRELENALESAMALSEGDVIEARFLPSFLLMGPPEHADFYQIPKDLNMRQMERMIINLTLERIGGNKTKAAELLGIGLRTLHRKIREKD